MEQKNVAIMGTIVDKLAEGKTLSEAMKEVYTKRTVAIPYSEGWLDCSVLDLGLSMRTAGALMRHRVRTIRDVVNYTKKRKITNIQSLGVVSGIELFEKILDYCWGQMTAEEQVSFLVDTVNNNSEYIKSELL